MVVELASRGRMGFAWLRVREARRVREMSFMFWKIAMLVGDRGRMAVMGTWNEGSMIE